MTALPDCAQPDRALSELGAVSGRAAVIVRGVQRLLADMGLPSLTEVRLSSGRRADVLALSARGAFTLIEVKSCLQDLASDGKWPEYAPFCDLFYFAVDCDFPQERIPKETGLIVADSFGGAIVRPAPVTKLSPARRKAMTLGFARLAAARLLRTADESAHPEPALGEAG